MGRIYRARDRRLGRSVAIKVLGADGAVTPEAVARLRREAIAASSLNHPSILTVYDIGEAPQAGLYIAMELIEGTNLREWLRGNRSTEQKLDLLRQVAGGLAAAHARGIVHRDVKPENIMVSHDGRAKLVDFGLAKPVAATPADDAATDVMVTAQGQIAGTLAYMSPEQLRGEPVDARSDIFSFGCVLHEALSGRPPFGEGSAETIGRILRDDPDPLPRGIDPRLARIVERCLMKDRTARIQSMDAVIPELQTAARRSVVLRWAAVMTVLVIVIAVAAVLAIRPHDTAPAPSSTPARSIAVLAFRALGPSEESYVAEGITDAVTTDLAKQPGLEVIARNSTRRYGADADLRKTGADLRVRYLLLGSVQRLANDVRVDARLVDTTNDAHVWAEHYERPLSEIFSAEEAIVRAVASRIAPGSAAPAALKQSADPRVADLYLRARFFAGDVKWTTQDRSIPLLEQVVQLDPDFLPACIELADQYRRKAFEYDPDRQWEAKSYVQVEKILAADPRSAAAYVIRGDLHWNLAHGFAHEQAMADYDRGIELDPNLIRGYAARGSAFMHTGLLDEALSDFGHVLRLDPFNDFAAYRVARIHFYQQKYAQAVSELQRKWPADFQLPVALECMGRGDAALQTAESIATPGGARPPESRTTKMGNRADIESALAVLYARRGWRSKAEESIRTSIADGEGGSHFHHAMYFIALAYAQMHDAEDALHWLDRTAREGMPCFPLFARDPLLDPIRSDPGMREFLDASRQEWEQRRHGRRAS